MHLDKYIKQQQRFQFMRLGEALGHIHEDIYS